MNKLTGFVTITRNVHDGIGKAVAYTKDGSRFDFAVVMKTPIFDSNMDVGGVWLDDKISWLDEVRTATASEILFFKLRTTGYGDTIRPSSYKDFLYAFKEKVELKEKRGKVFGSFYVVSVENAEKACKMAVKELAGPVGIVDYMAETGEQAESFGEALENILLLAALIAVNLAIMNLLPIPALDGGRIFLLLVTCVIEAITKKKLDPKYEGYIHLAGMVLLLGLMVFVLYNDIVRIVTR